ncbi:MAG: DUF2867 domain-containing protein [Pseudomonadota bacterium]
MPNSSLLTSRRGPRDFLDCYVVRADMGPRRAAQIITNFPDWVAPLMGLRRIVTAPFGLSNDGPAAADKLGIFPVEQETERELIVGFDDKHLNFRVSVLCEDGLVHLATWVRPHNFGGRAYLTAVLPFHVLIIRNALRRVAATSEH